MSTTLWDTSGSEVVTALQTERRKSGAVSLGLALTLIVVVDEKHVEDAEEAATTAAAEHPCRTLIVVRRSHQAEDRLDAEVSVGGRLGPGEAVILRMYGRLSLHAESVVLPLLAPDAPVVTWFHGAPPDIIATDPLGVLADRRVTDCAQAEDPVAALKQRAEDYAHGDTDLAWTRTTTWRAMLASAFDTPLPAVTQGVVTTEPHNPSADLLAAWLSLRLGVEVEVAQGKGPALLGARLALAKESDDGDAPTGSGSSPESADADADEGDDDPEGPSGASTDDAVDGDARYGGDDPNGEDGLPPFLEVTRGDGNHAVLRRPGQPDRNLPLSRLGVGELLAEELRRLDPDAPYAEALGHMAGVSGLADRPDARRHVWSDPAERSAAGESERQATA